VTAAGTRRRRLPTLAEAIERAAPPGFDHLAVTPEGERLYRLARRLIRGTSGVYAGKPFELDPWEVLGASELLRGRDAGEPVYREALIGVGRGNGKSGFGSVLAWDGLLVEAIRSPGAEIYLAASVREQARIIFRELCDQRLASPLLASWTKGYRDAIECPELGSVIRVLSGDRAGGAAHGLRPDRIIADELHAWRNPELYYALRTAMHKKPDSLLVGITTAGFDLNTIAGELYLKGMAGRDPRFLFLWPELTEAAEAELDRLAGELREARTRGDGEAIEAARRQVGAIAKRVNPARFVTGELLAETFEAVPFPVFLRLHGNRWTRAEELWLPAGAWERCRVDGLAIDPELPAWAGVDYGARHDTAAVAIAQPQGERVAVFAWIIGVHSDRTKPAPPCHELLEGDRIDHALVEERISAVMRGEGFPDGRGRGLRELRVLGGDPWRMSRSLELLQERGLLAVEYPMTNARMAPASQRLYDGVTSVALAHDGDDVLAAHIHAATAKETERGWRLWKLASKAPMDGAIATLIAVDLAADNAGGGFQLRFLGDQDELDLLEASVSGEERRRALIEEFVELAEPIPWDELDREDAVRLSQELVELAGRYRARGNEELAARLLAERERRLR
jgi:phage terminase large subunit-like protein